ncbi:hypothetical protein BKA62DRAFT_774208 [Auriculariales sp. MPI-PUGE-AT-0066]|nr:hypothetical protein BKA62DRAFT_774208 [Auriculariales sp. MPI-PUGE-AT-0066]
MQQIEEVLEPLADDAFLRQNWYHLGLFCVGELLLRAVEADKLGYWSATLELNKLQSSSHRRPPCHTVRSPHAPSPPSSLLLHRLLKLAVVAVSLALDVRLRRRRVSIGRASSSPLRVQTFHTLRGPGRRLTTLPEPLIPGPDGSPPDRNVRRHCLLPIVPSESNLRRLTLVSSPSRVCPRRRRSVRRLTCILAVTTAFDVSYGILPSARPTTPRLRLTSNPLTFYRLRLTSTPLTCVTSSSSHSYPADVPPSPIATVSPIPLTCHRRTASHTTTR